MQFEAIKERLDTTLDEIAVEQEEEDAIALPEQVESEAFESEILASNEQRAVAETKLETEPPLAVEDNKEQHPIHQDQLAFLSRLDDVQAEAEEALRFATEALRAAKEENSPTTTGSPTFVLHNGVSSQTEMEKATGINSPTPPQEASSPAPQVQSSLDKEQEASSWSTVSLSEITSRIMDTLTPTEGVLQLKEQQDMDILKSGASHLSKAVMHGAQTLLFTAKATFQAATSTNVAKSVKVASSCVSDAIQTVSQTFDKEMNAETSKAARARSNAAAIKAVTDGLATVGASIGTVGETFLQSFAHSPQSQDAFEAATKTTKDCISLLAMVLAFGIKQGERAQDSFMAFRNDFKANEKQNMGEMIRNGMDDANERLETLKHSFDKHAALSNERLAAARVLFASAVAFGSQRGERVQVFFDSLVKNGMSSAGAVNKKQDVVKDYFFIEKSPGDAAVMKENVSLNVVNASIEIPERKDDDDCTTSDEGEITAEMQVFSTVEVSPETAVMENNQQDTIMPSESSTEGTADALFFFAKFD
jgi:hypothetical protein